MNKDFEAASRLASDLNEFFVQYMKNNPKVSPDRHWQLKDNPLVKVYVTNVTWGGGSLNQHEIITIMQQGYLLSFIKGDFLQAYEPISKN